MSLSSAFGHFYISITDFHSFMSLSVDDVRYIASLARLRFEADEEAKLAEQMSQILGYVSKLDELDTSDVEPMAHVLDAKNVFREDVARQRISHEDGLRNAPDADGDFFRVPKVIE